MGSRVSERYWDERARENALFYVDNRVDYADPDEEAFWRGGDEALTRMLAAVGLAVAPTDVVADIGCGVGRLTRALAERAATVYGIDVSSEMLALARRHNAHLPNVEWRHGDGETLAVLGDASVDGCFSHVVFQHLPRAEMTLGYVREMGRVLRPGGWALFQVSMDPSVHRRPRRERLKDRLRGRDESAWSGSWVEEGALRAAAAAGGLTIERLLDPGTQYATVLARRS